jgi:uncharacterized membrane protein
MRPEAASAGVGPTSGRGLGRRGPILLALLALLGIGVAAYLTTVHYDNIPLLCSSTGIVNCAEVLTSQYSVIPGTSVPITVPGIGYFLVSLLLALAQFRRPFDPDLRKAHFGWACLGLLTVFYLVFDELVELKVICLWCTSVHLMIILTLIITAWRLQPAEQGTLTRS